MLIYYDFYYIFDAEGTLFFTDKLNNESYNYALKINNLDTIIYEKRITRQIITKFYPNIKKGLLNAIISQKQKYFIEHIYKAKINYFLFDIIKRLEKYRLFIWTKSDKNKIYHLLDNFNLIDYFNCIIFSEKNKISEDIKYICNIIRCDYDQLLIFENDISIANELKNEKVNCILLYYFDRI